ncbi:GldG family protein, partial [Thermodesulfobacteriota bacterium]
MSDKKRGFEKSLFSAGGMVLVLFILVLINVISSRVNFRWDATHDNLYSLSESTKKIISNLEQDVVIKVFYSKSLANIPSHIKNHAGRMLDFLSEYENYSNKKVIVEVYDPKIDSEEEEWAQKYGLEGIDMPTGDKIYLGLVAVAADQEEVIKMMVASREEHLEYDITRIIARVQSPEKPRIGIISSLPVFGRPQNPYTRQPQQPSWHFTAELKKTYDVNEISLTSQRFDPDINLLFIIHPKSMSPSLQYAVDQYVLNGGSVIVFVDPYSTVDPAPRSPKSSSLNKLFAAWGVSMDSVKALIDFNYATRVRVAQNRVETNPFWVSLQPAAFNADNIITSKLESMLLPAVGTIQKTADSSFEYEPLLQSSTNSALSDLSNIRTDVEQIRRDFKSSLKTFDLAVKVSGSFKTAFPDGKPEVEAKDPPPGQAGAPPEPAYPEKAPLKTGTKPATIIIVADTDL